MLTHRLTPLALLAAAAFAVAAPPAAVDDPSQAPGRVGRAAERFSLGLRGVYFVENQGQWTDESVCFGLKSRGLDVAFRESAFTMHLSREQGSTSRAREEAVLGVEGEDAPAEFDAAYSFASDYGGQLADLRAPLSRGRRAPLPHGRGSSGEPAEYEHLTLTVSFPGSNAVTPRGAQEQTAKFNYFVGGEGRGTASNVPSFGAVIYENLYDGIDLLVTGNDDGVMKYEFHCAPGADYTQIRIHYDGIDSLCVNAEGDLEIATTFGTLLDGAPIVWQEDIGSTSRAGHTTSRAREEAVLDAARAAPLPDSRGPSGAMRTTLPARFDLIDTSTYRIALDTAPNPLLPLVIDPEIEWMAYLGGSSNDIGSAVAIGVSGSIWITGETESVDFEGRLNGVRGGGSPFDAFLTKVDSSGVILWMTYLGGWGSDDGRGVVLLADGSAVVAGMTKSANFEGRINSYHGSSTFGEGFVLQVDASGQLLWMTYVGGSTNDSIYAIARNGIGNVLVAGNTDSVDFEGRQNSLLGRNDAFVARISAFGSVQWMTYLGGSQDDCGHAIAIDDAGAARVAGQTTSDDFLGRVNEYHGEHSDAFVVQVDPIGQVEWMTYLGGSNNENATGVASDMHGNSLVAGTTVSIDFDGRLNAYHGRGDPFVAKVSNSGEVQWMTYLGGREVDIAEGVATNGRDALLTGLTTSRDFRGRLNSKHGDYDAFVAKVDSTGVVSWMAYLGGSAFDASRNIVLHGANHAIVAGYSYSEDFEGQSNSHHGGARDAFVLKLDITSPALLVTPTCPSGGPIRIEWSGASPGGQVALIFARNTGSFIIPNNRPCAGTQLGLGSNQIQLAFQGGAGANGSRTLNANAGPGACGGYMQLLDLTTCSTSNVARVE